MFANTFGDHDNVCCGLVKIIKREEDEEEEWDEDDEWEPVKTPIPLISVDVKASVIHAVAQVEVTQTYVNKEEKPIEAIYYFPVNPEGAVTHFQAELEGRVIKGIVKPQEEAKADYDKAVENQTTAFMGEETKADIFKVRVGFLKPGTQVKVIIGYVTEVKNEPGTNAIRFYVPTTIAPRYVSEGETDDKVEDIKQMTFSPSSPAPLQMKVAVSLQGGIKSIESPTHEVTVEKTGFTISQNGIWHKAVVQLSGETKDMDRDFVLNILPEEPQRPSLYCEKAENGSTAMMIHLIPRFRLDEQKAELIFVLDRSGSMSGKSIKLAKEALLAFLHSMPADCYFNVVGFGSSYKFLFRKSEKYSDKTLKKAIAHAESLHADLGGTDILGPLKAIYGQPGVDGYLRQLFILTDGEVFNTDAVLGIAQANANKARVFALGIGDGASHHLVEGLAKAGGGTSAFVTYKEKIDKKVLNQLKNGLQPSLTDIELEWEGLSTKPVGGKATSTEVAQYKQSPKRIPPVYDGSQMLVFGLFKDECPKSVKIKAQSPDGPLTITVENLSSNEVDQTGMLHGLAAVKLVRELELEESALQFQDLAAGDAKKQAEKLKKEIVEIACQNGITSKYTSFVAIDVKEDKPSTENWVMETRNVPQQFAHGWHGGYQPSCGSAAPRRACKSKRSASAACAKKKKKAPAAAMKRRPAPAACSMKKKPTASRRAPTASKAPAKPQRRTPARKCKDSAMEVDSDEEDSEEDSDDSEVSSEEDSEVSSEEDSSEEDSEDEDSNKDPEVSNKGHLFQLISLQSYDGSYAFNKQLAAIIGKSLKDMEKGASQHKLEKPVFATALAISYFDTKMKAEKDVWELIVTKARKWLAKKVQPEKVDGVIKTATTFLGA